MSEEGRASVRAVSAQNLAFAILLGATAYPGSEQTASGQNAVVITGRDLGLVAGATVGSAVLSRLDAPIAHVFGDSGFHARHAGVSTAAKRASLVTETVLMLAGGAVYGGTRLRHDDGTADVALHTTESVATAALFIQVVRGALGRARPYVANEVGGKRDTHPYDFELLHGFTSFSYRSFPSMHAMASVAVATALSREMQLRDTPHRAALSSLLYAGAAAPALARMYLDEHWASDIAMGAFLGAFAGQKVVAYSHEHPGNRIDRAFLGRRMSVGLTSGDHGLAFSASPF